MIGICLPHREQMIGRLAAQVGQRFPLPVNSAPQDAQTFLGGTSCACDAAFSSRTTSASVDGHSLLAQVLQ